MFAATSNGKAFILHCFFRKGLELFSGWIAFVCICCPG